MSTNLNYKQVANVERRTWDVETYDKRAKERANNDDGTKTKKSSSSSKVTPREEQGLGDINEDLESTKEEFLQAAPGAAGPHMSKRAFLKARKRKVDVDSKVGSVEIVNPEAAATTKANASGDGVGSTKDGVTKTGIGWHCRVCDCFLRDSHTYLDHINGKKHQRNLGYSMRVERSTKDQISSRLAVLTKEKEQSKDSMLVGAEEDFHDLVKVKDEEAKRRKEERARQRKERKQKAKEEAQKPKEEEPVEDDEEEDVEEGGIDPAMAAMMGFSGFGGSNKS